MLTRSCGRGHFALRFAARYRHTRPTDPSFGRSTDRQTDPMISCEIPRPATTTDRPINRFPVTDTANRRPDRPTDRPANREPAARSLPTPTIAHRKTVVCRVIFREYDVDETARRRTHAYATVIHTVYQYCYLASRLPKIDQMRPLK